VLEHESGRLATVRLRAAPSALLVDLLFASSGVEPEVVAEADTLSLAPDVALRVARAGHLIALKLLSRDDVRRPQDRVDLAALVTIADDEELARARRACASIVARGYACGRELLADLDEALALWRMRA
jgi:hypothetical protein